jgi:hypothetical protein
VSLAGLELQVTITAPNGAVLDVTDRISADDMGSITESVEDDLLELVHGDMDFELADSDGIVAAFFEGAEASDLYEIVVLREGTGRRPGWTRLFAGVLDLPWSVQIDRKDKRVSVQAFSNSNRLERTSAESIKRDVSGRTITTTAGAATATLSSTTDVKSGDQITATDSTAEETRTVATVDSATQVTCTENWSKSFSAATLTLETPYLRNKTVEYLAGQAFTTAGVTTYDVETGDQPFADYPVATELNTDGLNTSLYPRSLTIQSGKITATFNSGNRKQATSPSSGFVDGAAATTAQGDWRPYLSVEPAGIEQNGILDDGRAAWDHTNGFYYTLRTYDSGAGLNAIKLMLVRDGVDLAEIDGFGTTGSGDYHDNMQLDYEPANNRVWVSARRSTDIKIFKYYDVGGASVGFVETLNTVYGNPRSVASLSYMAFHRKTGSAGAGSTSMDLYRVSDRLVDRTVTVPTSLLVWTLRATGAFAAALYTSGSTVRVILWSLPDWTQVADYEVAASSGGTRLLTVFEDATRSPSEFVFIGAAGGRYFVLSRYFDGVISYANFEGMSCAAALRELALVSLSVVMVDHYNIGSLRSRSLIESDRNELEVTDPLEQTTLPVWEQYRNSVEVTGESESGDEVRAIAGVTGDSSHRLELDSKLVTHESIAQVVGAQYHAFLSVSRVQENVTVAEADMEEPARPFGRLVRMLGRRFLVLEAETDPISREQDLTLVEV